MSAAFEQARADDLAGLGRRLIRLARAGQVSAYELDEAEKRIEALLGPYADTLALRPSECRRFVAERLADVRGAARRLGYAIAVHGSLDRDVDLVAVPWVDEAWPPHVLVADLMTTIGRCDLCNGEQPAARPQGRLSWSIWMHEYSTYLDLSVMPGGRG